MDKKVMGIIAVVVIAIIACFALGIGSNQVGYKTFEFEGCTLELPADTVVNNQTEDISNMKVFVYEMNSSSTSTSSTLRVVSDPNLGNSSEDYINRYGDQDKKVESYKDKWVILHDTPGDKKYVALLIEDGHGYSISNDNLDTLKQMVDTFKLKK